MAVRDDTYKLPMRCWLANIVDNGEISGLEWIDQKKNYIKIPWAKMHHPGWESCDQVVSAWAQHQNRQEKKGVKSDFSTLKANFRNAIHKSEDFEYVEEKSRLQNQAGNFKVYKLLSRWEVEQKKSEKKLSRDTSRKRKICPKFFPGGKLVCDEQNFDDGSIKELGEKDLCIPGVSENRNSFQLANGFHVSPTEASPCLTAFGLEDQPTFNACETHLNEKDGAISLCTPDVDCSSVVTPLNSQDKQAGCQDSTIQLFSMFNIPTDNLQACGLHITYNGGAVLNDELKHTQKGYRIFYGDDTEIKEMLCLQRIPQEDSNDYKYSAIRLPHPKSEFKQLQEILNRTELGLTFRYDPECFSFFVKRLCQSQIFYVDPCCSQSQKFPIKIERKAEIPVFSYEKFLLAQCDAVAANDSQRLVHPIINLSIGSKSNLHPENQSPRGIKIKLFPTSLKNMLHDEILSGPNSIHISHENDTDRLLKIYKELKI